MQTSQSRRSFLAGASALSIAGFAVNRAAAAEEAPLETTVAELLAWFRSLPAERQAKLRAGMTPEQESALLAAWKAQAG